MLLEKILIRDIRPRSVFLMIERNSKKEDRI